MMKITVDRVSGGSIGIHFEPDEGSKRENYTVSLTPDQMRDFAQLLVLASGSNGRTFSFHMDTSR